MYNWIFALKGEINTFWSVKDRLEDFDVIQVNMSPQDFETVLEIRRRLKNSSTKLVINNDYVCEKWNDWGISPYLYDNIQRAGDMVFGTEPHQVSNMIDGTFCIPHPTNTKWVKRLGTDAYDDAIGFVFHWWAGETYLPHRTIEKVKAKYGVEKAKIYGYKEQWDKNSQAKKLMWDTICPLDDFTNYAERVQGDKILYDPNPMHTYGRNGVEMACWKKPVVGSNRVFSYNKLIPELTCDPYDFRETMKRFDLVFNHPDKVAEIMDRAYKEVEWFNYKNSVARFKEALEIATDRGGHKWYGQQS
jgi:hypothetical protein|tara:strand:- start:17776 stop:18684 length:909 start_codon:yes stop_codon:yes gene_type:complete